MPSAPSRFEVEHLHRLMIEASVEAAQLDQRLDEGRNADSLWPVLRHWSEAAEALDEAVDRASPGLQREGTPKDQIDRIRERLDHLEQRSRQFELDFDLDDCIETWQSIGHDFAQLSGRHRDALVALLRHHQPAVDQATAMLSEAQRNEGLLREQHRKVVALQTDRDRARAKYERLRQSYLGAQRDWEAAERQKGTQAPAQQQEVKKPPLPDLSLLPKERPWPLLVRLPVQKEGAAKPPSVVPGPAAIAKHSAPKLVTAKKEEPASARKPRGPARIKLERIERVGGYPTSQDGIGRGAQTASIWFRADHLEDAVLIQGTSAIELGCGTHLDVMPSVQIFSAIPGQPVRGKVSLLLIASGGHLGGITPRSAQTGAMLAAAAGAGAVVARLGALGKALQAAIREAIEDAATKVFARAQPKAPPHLRPRPHAAAAEHHLARFDQALGPFLFEARAVQQGKLQLHRLLERDHQQRNLVAARLERTLSHLATAAHRTLTDPSAGQLRVHLAQMDSVLARLHGKGREELLEGAHAVGSILRKMNSIAASAGGASHIAGFRKLIEERKAELQRIARAQLAAELPHRGATGLEALADKPQAARGLPGTANLRGGFQSLGSAHLGGFGGGARGGLGALAGTQGALGTTLAKQLEQRLRPGRPEETARVLREGSPNTALRELAARADLKRKQLAARAAKRPVSPISATALLERFREHPKGSAFAAQPGPGGRLRALCEVAQRGHGLPIGQAAQHYLASRGSSQVWNAVATFNTLVGEGHRPRFSFGSWLKKNVSDHVSHALQGVSQTVTQATSAATSLAVAAPRGISSFANLGLDIGRRATSPLGGLVRGAARGIGGAMVSVGRGALRAAEDIGRSQIGALRQSGHALAQVVSGGMQAARGAASWALRKAGAAADWSRQREQGAAHWLGEKVHSGLEWARKTGVAGAVGTGLRKGLSFVKSAVERTPLGYAVSKGYGFVKSGGLTKVWNATRHVAGQAWAGLKGAYQTTSKFLQSPAGQLLVTGLSLAASFIPGGIVVKAVIGAGIGAMQAISEGKDWKSVLASAAGGALTGALPFLKIGPLAKLGIGALQGGITALASGGSLKDALKGAAGGALDAFDPGAFHALKKLKGFTTAEKLLHGKNLSKAERQLLRSHKLAAPLRALEKAMSNPRARRTIGALEKATSRGVKGGIWVSGKAAKAQHALDKVVGAGDKLHGALSQVHDLAPSLADVLGDNAAGQFVGQVGDWAGESDDKLERALGYGHTASSTLSQYRGYLDKGLGFAGVKDPAKRRHPRPERSGLEKEFSGKVGATHDLIEGLPGIRKEGEHESATHLHGGHRQAKKLPHEHKHDPTKSIQHGLRAIEKYKRKAIRTGRRIDSGLTKVETALNKGVGVGKKVDSGLEKLAAVADQLGDMLGDDSALGHLAHQVGEGAGKGHEKLHQALHVAQTGEKFLHKGHQIFHLGLQAAQGHHARDLEKVHGKRPPDGDRHAGHEAHVAVHGGREPGKGSSGGDHGRAPPEASPEQAVQNALHWVTAFGQQVSAAVKQIERLMHAGRTKEAGDRVQALRAMSEQTRVEVTRAVQAAAHDPQLSKEAASARKHYLEIRAHLLQFIRGLQGLDARGAGEVEAQADRAHAGGSPARTQKHQDPIGDLIDGILGGEDGRIHADRGAARGDVRVVDFQEVDAAALDTWIGSGEGAMLFSEVFGAFIPAEGATVVHHRRHRGGDHAPQEQRGSRPKRGGFFARLFDRLEGFADRVAGWAKKGSTLLGKGMHYAELGMHGLSQLEGAAGKVQSVAGKTESFLEGIGLHTLAGYAGKIGGAAGHVDEEARTVHGGLKKADHWMGEGKHVADEVEHGAHAAAGIFGKVGHARFGALASLFKSSKQGDGTDGKLSPEKVRLGSVFDEPRRLDVATLSKMQSFLGGDFSGVRIHTGLGAAEVTRRFNAEAVTVKDHIFFAPGRFNPASAEGQKLIAHELTHVLQKGRANLDVRTAEGEALHSEHSYGHGPPMETLNLRRPEPGFRLAPDGEGMGSSSGIHTARRTRSRGHETGGKDELPDGEEFLEQISGRVYELLMEDLEHAFESR